MPSAMYARRPSIPRFSASPRRRAAKLPQSAEFSVIGGQGLGARPGPFPIPLSIIRLNGFPYMAIFPGRPAKRPVESPTYRQWPPPPPESPRTGTPPRLAGYRPRQRARASGTTLFGSRESNHRPVRKSHHRRRPRERLEWRTRRLRLSRGRGHRRGSRSGGTKGPRASRAFLETEWLTRDADRPCPVIPHRQAAHDPLPPTLAWAP